MTTIGERKRKPASRLNRFPAALKKAIRAAQSKKAIDVVVLDLTKADAFTDYFLICSGQNLRQLHAIVEAVEEALAKAKSKPSHVEGSQRAAWVLLDFFDFVVHVFTPETRAFYGLERLWGIAERIEIPDDAFPEDSGASR